MLGFIGIFVYRKTTHKGQGNMQNLKSIQKSRSRHQDFYKNDRNTAFRARVTGKHRKRTIWLTFEELESLVVSTDLKPKDVARVLDVSTTTLRRSAEIYSVIYNGQPVNMYDLLLSRVKRGRKSKQELV